VRHDDGTFGGGEEADADISPRVPPGSTGIHEQESLEKWRTTSAATMAQACGEGRGEFAGRTRTFVKGKSSRVC